MARRTFTIAVVLLIALTVGCAADTIWDYEAVDANGIGTHPLVAAFSSGSFSVPQEKVTVEGVALAGYNDVSDPDSSGGYYTAFMQDTGSNCGGIQIWAGSWFYGALWSAYRQSYYVNFQAGDRLRVTGYLADAHRGKVVINHLHTAIPSYAFTVEVLDHPGLPEPTLITNVSDCNYFDQSRAGGGEYYQTRYVRLYGVQVKSGTWASGQQLSVGDSTGEVGMLLSSVKDFSDSADYKGSLSVVGIFDQEDTSVPCTSNYRVWVTDSSNIAMARVVSRVFDDCFYVQEEGRQSGIKVIGSFSVNPGDRVALQGTFTSEGPEQTVEATTCPVVFSGDEPKPVFVNGKTLAAEHGLGVFGILVRCCGTLGQSLGDGDYDFTTDNGDVIRLTKAAGITAQEGDFVAVNAIASLEDDGITPKLILGDPNDLTVMYHPSSL
ncbi:hypothetical protein LLG46_12895 [bacterium]|nr:hypothetical protein [bacterium]